MNQTKKFPLWGKILIVVGVIVIALGAIFISPYNTMIEKEENVTTMQANIQTSLQSRLDKINELMPSVQAILDHESEVYKDIAALRSNMEGVAIDEDGNLTLDSNATTSDLEQADAASSQILRDINVAIEAYPQLQAQTVMQDFMTSVEGIENRLSVARDNYNQAVQDYNTYVRKFPNNVIAGIFGFSPKEKYQASDEAQDAPTVDLTKATINRSPLFDSFLIDKDSSIHVLKDKH